MLKVCSLGGLRFLSIFLFSALLGFGIPVAITGCGGGSGSGFSGSGGGGDNNPTPPPPTAPSVTSISPTKMTAGSASATLTVNGSGFVTGSVVEVSGTAEATSYVSATQLTATVSASQIANGGELAVTVVNGTTSSSGTPVNLEVDYPVPTITSVSPTVEATGMTSAVVTAIGTGFVPATTINVNGAARSTTFSSTTQVSVTLTTADLSTAGSLSLTAVNPTPGGGTSTAVTLSVTPPSSSTPVISAVSPNSIYARSGDTNITVSGTGFTANSVVEWNGSALTTSEVTHGYGAPYLIATVPAADLNTAGTASVTVETPEDSPSISNALTVTINNPPAPTLTRISSNAGAINTAQQITLQGTGFVSSTVVEVNGTPIPTTYVGSTSITATIPAYSVAAPGNVNVTVTTPAPGGGTSTSEIYTAYVGITTSDIVYNPTDGLLYASVPGNSPDVTGNSVVGVDPTTGNVVRQIWVGSNPNKLALSTDGTQLFVGLDGAAAVAQVNMTTGKLVNQFSLGGGPGVYNPPMTALYLTAIPGSPNSVAVATQAGTVNSGTGITIYDSGVARAHSWTSGEGPMSFGSSASTLYVLAGSTVEKLTVDSTGITGATALSTVSGAANWIQYDSGKLYLSSGQVLNASTGALQGTFYSSANTPATGAIVSDSSLGKAFIGQAGNTNTDQLVAFDESSFNLLGSIPVNGVGESGYGGTFAKIVRWGQNGVAMNSAPAPFSPVRQLFIFQLPLVKDLSSSPADLSITLSAPSAATTGAAISYVATVKNLGSDTAQGVTAGISLDSTLIINKITTSQGSCGTTSAFSCDLGDLASGSSATVTVSATPSRSGTLAGTASVSSTSYDPTQSNNHSTTSTTATGGIYGAVPAISAISPNLVQAGSSDFMLTVIGSGFNETSTVNLGNNALSTTFVSATELTASVTAAEVANYGWAPVPVSNPSPGGGVSQVLPLTIYDLVNVPASGILFDPYSQMLYATVPGTATTITGNSVVSIDPVTGAAGTPVAVGSQPTVMAETTDGDYLYVGLKGADSLAKFNLLNQSLTATIPLTMPQNGTPTSIAATWLAAMPGNDNTLAIGTTNTWGNFGIFDVNGSTGAFRPNLSGIYAGTHPVFADASHIYAYDTQTSGAEFYRYSVDANGLTEIDGTTLNGIGGFGGGFQLADGLVYGYGGGIVNPSTTPPSQVATLPLIDFYGSGATGEGVGLAVDPSLGKGFLMLENLAGTSAFGLTRYDLRTYLPQAVLNLPASFSGVNSNWTVLRWGQDGLALLTSTEDPVTNQTTSSILLLRGPFVTPQELGKGTEATLVTSSSSTIAHGSGNTVLTLTGTNFQPGVAVTWNGSYRTTTIVDASHVKVAIPAGDLASAGSVSLVATNPGAAASNTLHITID
jgi:hypothetical protein